MLNAKNAKYKSKYKSPGWVFTRRYRCGLRPRVTRHASRVTCHALVHVPAVLVTAQDNKVRLELVLASSNK